MKIWSALAALTLCICCIPSWGQDAKLPSLVDYKIGETWEWSEKLVENTNPAKLKMESFDIREVILEQGEKKFRKTSVYGKTVSAIEENGGKPKEKPFRHWPLKVGAKWRYESSWKAGDGSTGSMQQDVEVAAYEKITVLSGTYDAFKIAYRGTYKNARGSGEMNDTYWYAPSIKADVKHINESGGQTYTSELVKYSPGSE